MSQAWLLLAGLFLPLFPLSMVFNDLFNRIGNGKLRIVLLMVWPQIGVAIVHAAGIDVPGWIMVWALLTALLYGFRSLVLREVSLWVSFVATSAWAVLWLVMTADVAWSELFYYALGFSVPLALLIVLSGELETRFGAAYTGLYNGIAETLPRLSGVLVIAVLAVVATPVFPGFSVMMAAILHASAQSLVTALLLLLVWLVWGWTGARLLHGLIIGDSKHTTVSDLGSGRAWSYGALLVVMAVIGMNMIGGLA